MGGATATYAPLMMNTSYLDPTRLCMDHTTVAHRHDGKTGVKTGVKVGIVKRLQQVR